jgi:hypothetical protein
MIYGSHEAWPGGHLGFASGPKCRHVPVIVVEPIYENAAPALPVADHRPPGSRFNGSGLMTRPEIDSTMWNWPKRGAVLSPRGAAGLSCAIDHRRGYPAGTDRPGGNLAGLAMMKVRLIRPSNGLITCSADRAIFLAQPRTPELGPAEFNVGNSIQPQHQPWSSATSAA